MKEDNAAEFQALRSLCQFWRAGQDRKFGQIVDKSLHLKVASTMQLSNAFHLPVNAPAQWVKGAALPHPNDQQRIVAFIRSSL